VAALYFYNYHSRADDRSNGPALSEVPGFFVLHFDHNEAVGRHGGAGF